MAQRTNLVIKDQAATPADHTFTPDGDDANGVHLFSEKTGVPAGNLRFSASIKTGSGKYKPTLRFTLPVVQTQTINGISAPTIVRSAYAEVSFTFDSLSTLQERKDAVAYVRNVLAVTGQAQIYELLTDLSDIY